MADDDETDPFIAGVTDKDAVVLQTNCSALLWSREGGYSLLLHPRGDMDVAMEREEMALAAIFLRLGDETFVEAMVQWIGQEKNAITGLKH